MKTPLVVVLLATMVAAPVGSVGSADPCPAETIPAEIDWPSSIGQARFPHEMHFDGIGIDCVTCHHEIDAKPLDMPHPQFFEDFWINCTTCHHNDAPRACIQGCSTCHHGSPTGIADESLSAKVVIHRTCWTCHEAGRGPEASGNCATCHSGPPSTPTSSAAGEDGSSAKERP